MSGINQDNFREKILFILPMIGIPLIIFLKIYLDLPIGIAALVFVMLILIQMFLLYEKKKPNPEVLIPISVLVAIGSVSRILFMPWPAFQPMTAIIIIAGCSLGATSGYMTGCLSALVSNMILGQGLWTPWQMLAWGLIGFLSGVFFRFGLIRGKVSLIIFGIISSYCFGIIMNTYHVITFINPDAGSLLFYYLASLRHDSYHAISTVLSLLFIGKVWIRKIARIKQKFALID